MTKEASITIPPVNMNKPTAKDFGQENFWSSDLKKIQARPGSHEIEAR